MMADSVLMYTIAAASFIGLSIILHLLKHKIRHESPLPLVFPKYKNESRLTSLKKRPNSPKEFFAMKIVYLMKKIKMV